MRRRPSATKMFEGKYEQRTFEGGSASSTGGLLKFHDGLPTSHFRLSLRQRIRKRPRLAIVICIAAIAVVLALSLGLGLGLALGSHHKSTAPGLVDLGYSRYQGQTVSGGIDQWLGIRYAAPPVGDLRFSAPQAPPRTDTILQADQVCSVAMFANSARLTLLYSMDLNAWVPVRLWLPVTPSQLGTARIASSLTSMLLQTQLRIPICPSTFTSKGADSTPIQTPI